MILFMNFPLCRRPGEGQIVTGNDQVAAGNDQSAAGHDHRRSGRRDRRPGNDDRRRGTEHRRQNHDVPRGGCFEWTPGLDGRSESNLQSDSAVNPMDRRSETGGFMSCRIAETLAACIAPCPVNT